MTSGKKPVWCLSRDRQFIDRIRPLLSSVFELHVFEHDHEFRKVMIHQRMSLCLIDVRLGDEGPEPDELAQELNGHVLILVGSRGSQHVRGLDKQGFYAFLDVSEEPAHFLHTLHQGQVHLDLREENQRLRSRLTQLRPPASNREPARPSPLFSPQECVRFFRQVGNPEQLAHSLIHNLCSHLKLSRAGLYVRDPNRELYTLKAGHMLLPGLQQESLPGDAPLVRWLERHAHVVSRDDLSAGVSPEDEMMLARALDQWGAELLIPLRGQHGLLGWVFTGRPFSGNRFKAEDLTSLTEAVDIMAAALESSAEFIRDHATLHRASSLLQELHIGVIHATPDGTLLWMSPTAQHHILRPQSPLPQQLSPDITRLIQQAGKDHTGTLSRAKWSHPTSGKDFSLQAKRIQPPDEDPTVLITVEDRSQNSLLQDREEQKLWEQMSDGLSHEVRNPLVTLKTFTQLLPERVDDPRFRKVFEEQVEKEIDKLQGLVEQVQSFARPEEGSLEPMKVRAMLESIASEFRKQVSQATPAPELHLSIQPELPDLMADPPQIRTALLHLLQNAFEAVQGSQGLIELGAALVKDQLVFHVQDNGAGCPPDQLDSLFSPFISTKAQGLGLGLPIARRVARDHGGELNLNSTPRGTRVTLTLPVSPLHHETPLDR